MVFVRTLVGKLECDSPMSSFRDHFCSVFVGKREFSHRGFFCEPNPVVPDTISHCSKYGLMFSGMTDYGCDMFGNSS